MSDKNINIQGDVKGTGMSSSTSDNIVKHSSHSQKSGDTTKLYGASRGKSVASVSSKATEAKAEAAAIEAGMEIKLKMASIHQQKALIDEEDLIQKAQLIRRKAEIEAEELIRSAEAKRKKEDFQCTLELLQYEERIAAAKARALTLEQEMFHSIEEGRDNPDKFDQLPVMDPDRKTSEYVKEHETTFAIMREARATADSYNGEDQNKCYPGKVTGLQLLQQPSAQTVNASAGHQDSPHTTNVSAVNHQWMPLPIIVEQQQRQRAQTVVETANLNPETNVMDGVNGWFQYFARKDLVVQSLTQFDDKAENFRAWKLSFKNAINRAQLTPNEELDLLVKWTGPKSNEIVKKIRSVNIHNPQVGLAEAWDRLEESYGRPEVVTNALLKLVRDFPKISMEDNQKLRELSDILFMLKAAKQEGDLPGLMYLDTYLGVNEMVDKLPVNIQGKWRTKGRDYKEKYKVGFPPFDYFATFVRKIADDQNDPSFDFNKSHQSRISQTRGNVRVNDFRERRSFNRQSTSSVVARKTEICSDSTPKIDPNRECPVHKKPHALKKCRTFREMSYDERIKILREFGICFRCCASVEHTARNCTSNEKCAECGSGRHIAALHMYDKKPQGQPSIERGHRDNGGEHSLLEATTPKEIVATCTEVCGETLSGKSCAKMCLVNIYPYAAPEKAIRAYVLLDDQSNRSLARTELFERFRIQGEPSSYSLRTCSGLIETTGRRASGLIIEGLDGKTTLRLPTLIECNEIPDSRTEIPTRAAAKCFPHLCPIADQIPEIDDSARILVLLGRDILQVHKVREQRNGPGNSPFAQRLDLGWVIVGNVCLNGPDHVEAYQTFVHSNGRTSFCRPCPNRFTVKEGHMSSDAMAHKPATGNQGVETDICDGRFKDGLGDTVFVRTKHDNQPGSSVEDRKFIALMQGEMFRDKSHSWVAPLPFKIPRPCLPDNRECALHRFFSLKRSLDKKPEMKKHYFEFMRDLFENNHAELAAPLENHDQCWYLPHFGVYHPRKPHKIRVVFDSSSQYRGVSLNDTLISGPDLMNSLLGVLFRFRHEQVAFVADIQQMFHSFLVREDHRDYLRFFWFRDNDPSAEVVEYKMRVHLFGNSPSPAVATYGLRETARRGETEYGADAKQFVERNFYVDDGLKSMATPEQAIDLLQRTQRMLADCNLRLHKIASNDATVMSAFAVEDRCSDLKTIDLNYEDPPLQHSLGVCWDVKSDSFTVEVSDGEKPYTRRGLLSVINSLYDPFGFVAPVTIKGKQILRNIMTLGMRNLDWDESLPTESEDEWNSWRNSLHSLSNLHIPRPYFDTPLAAVSKLELHIFVDASDVAIAACAYLRAMVQNDEPQVSFVMGKTKLAPTHATSTPRLELCAAVLGVELFELVSEEIDLNIDSNTFYSDSRVVLGYIHNETRRFYVYVSNRVERIRRATTPQQWCYVPTDKNPADLGTRSVGANKLAGTAWLSGPSFLRASKDMLSANSDEHIELQNDSEVRPQVSTLHTEVKHSEKLGTERFTRFSCWTVLIRAIGRLTHIARCFSKESVHFGTCRGWHYCSLSPSPEEASQARNLIFQNVQANSFQTELYCLEKGQSLPKDSPLRSLNPFLDSSGILRVGGRLNRSDLPVSEKNPLIIPGNFHIATLVVRYYHGEVQHQGRHFTHGAIRSAGIWIIGGRRLINKVIHECVKCRKTRGKLETQVMADLPPERLSVDAPFTYVGLDVFGPWTVVARRTRGGMANSKRWAMLFTCMSVRAVHIEVIEEMSASAAINALRRFFAIRGPAKQLRSDNGSNFVGARNELANLNQVDEEKIRQFLINKDCTWDFNPPHSSHMGGVWERMIGVARRILDSMFKDLGPTQLTHDVLVTLMAEVSAIINARPLLPVSSDPEVPEILTPAMLLTQKQGVSATNAPGDLSQKDLHGRHWRRVQYLADIFWGRWRKEYLPLLQERRIWQDRKPNIECGDLVLVRDKTVTRNEWPVGRVIRVQPSDDGCVRKANINIVRNNTVKTFLRPVSELVLLMRAKIE